MKNGVRWILSLTLVGLVAVACGQGTSPTAPDIPAVGTSKDGKVSAHTGPEGGPGAGPGDCGAAGPSGSGGATAGCGGGGTTPPGPTPPPGSTPTPTPDPGFPFELTEDDPRFARVSFVDTSVPDCGTAGTDQHPYDEFPFFHSGGILDVQVFHGTLSDSYLNIFDNPFDPDDPCASAVGRDDDSGPGLEAHFSEPLPSGSYIVVVTNFSSGQFGTYDIVMDSLPVP